MWCAAAPAPPVLVVVADKWNPPAEHAGWRQDNRDAALPFCVLALARGGAREVCPVDNPLCSRYANTDKGVNAVRLPSGISGMRVIAGQAKGHHLKFPRGTDTRPATDLVRGAIFSILENMTADWERVLDLFSGSGALGIEALSRGAGWVDFVEREPKCCAVIKENLEKTGLAERAHVYCRSVSRAIAFLEGEYGIILMDPPYADRSIGRAIEQLAVSPLVRKDTIMVVTHSPRLSLEPVYGPLELIKEHRHGDSCIALYRKGGVP